MKIRIHGIQDGKHQIELTENVKNIPYFSSEFLGEVQLSGFLTKAKNRFNFSGTVKCKAQFFCDISLEEFIEEIVADIHLNFIADTQLFYFQKDSIKEIEEIAVHEDDEYFDISDEIKDILTVNIPMKKNAPKYKGKTFYDVFPQFANKNKDENFVDERWNALKNINLN